MLVNTCDLTGPALAYVVATLEGRTVALDPMGFGACSEGGYWVWEDTGRVYLKIGRNYDPASNWSQGGPILDREGISIIRMDSDDYDCPKWGATRGPRQRNSGAFSFYTSHLMGGPSQLIAGLRCWVASKLGDSVEIPEGLTG